MLKRVKRRLCINRNIVECKDGNNECNEYHSVVLIETLWNVKR